MYLAATIGHCNRYVINWPVPSPMDTDRYWNYPEEAIETHGRPETVNTGQGLQFTSEVFSNFVTGQGIKFSIDGKGRAVGNAFIERPWGSVSTKSFT